jgi:hypothetical protein
VNGWTKTVSDVLNSQIYLLYSKDEGSASLMIRPLLRVCQGITRHTSMSDTADVRSFSCGSPRHPFPNLVNIEIPQGVSSCVIATHGSDINVDGIAVAADVSFDPT